MNNKHPLLFPFYIIEKDNDFEFISTIRDIEDKLNDIDPSGDEEAHYFNIYVIKSNLKSENIGEDYMGSLIHFHINNDFFFKRCNTNGINSFLKQIKKYTKD